MDRTIEILNEFGDRVVKLSKINVGRSKNGRRIETTGTLRKSIKQQTTEDSEGLATSFYMVDYGALRDAGQLGKKRKILKGWNKSVFIPRGKGFTNKMPPVAVIKKWAAKKPIRLRTKSGQFKRNKESELNAQAFLIARKIQNEGIQPGLFFSEPFNELYKELPDKVINAYSEDMDELFKDSNDDINSSS